MQEEKKVQNTNAGSVHIVNSDSGIRLYPHQENAFAQMTEKIINSHKYPYKGLLVLPTGGGKTMTAARWIAENIIDKGIKVLWIAHRHELLEQAQRTFSMALAYHDVFPQRDKFDYRLISGIHDKPVNIRSTDDILFASKDSLASERSFGFLYDNWLKDNDEVFLVIDEAHHACARTYRRLIERIESVVKNFRMLGLTATPIRTNDTERGYLHKIFPDDMVFEISLRNLIRQGILSEPKFEEIKTELDLTQELSPDQIRKLHEGFDFDSIGMAVASTIANNSERNNLIVNRYVSNKEKYGKTIVFAVNKENTIVLSKLFNERGVRADFVMSDVRDASGLHSISSKDNKDKIARFRKGGDIDVLVNVNILTEGTDVPDVQSVFLTRPTSSKIMMTQMMGRGLRGEKAGGTKDAYIVTFIDNWDENIAWVNPEKLYIDELDFNDLDPETRKRITRLIAISKMEEFAILSDKKIDPKKKAQLESIDFIKRIPKGIYQFRYPTYKENGEPYEKVCEILVYDNLESAYKNLLADIPNMFCDIRNEFDSPENISTDNIMNYSDACVAKYFADVEPYPAFRLEDIDDLLYYYFVTGELPTYFELPDRDKYDVSIIANHIIESDFGEKRKNEYISEKWSTESEAWQTFFDFSEKNFRNEVQLAINRILHPEDYVLPTEKPHEIFEDRRYVDMSLWDIRKHDPQYYQWLHDKVFEKFTDSEGFYFSAQSGKKSNNKLDFEIDHIKPLSAGGKTVLDNLQLLTVKENRQKGTKYDEESDDEIRRSKRAQPQILRVTRTDGSIVECKTATQTFAEMIEDAGIENVKNLNIFCASTPLIANVRRDKYVQKQLSDGQFLFTNFSTHGKKIWLDKISDKLNLGWQVDIIEKQANDDTNILLTQKEYSMENFRLTVSDTFSIAKQLIVTGVVESGEISKGDVVTVNGKTATVEAITLDKKQIDHAIVGNAIGLLLPILTKKDVKKGDVIEK